MICLDRASSYYTEELLGKHGDVAIAHIRSRGITARTAFKFRLGFASNLGGLYKNLSFEGIKTENMIMSGLIIENTQSEKENYFDRFKSRLMIPICDSFGDVIGFGGRALEGPHGDRPRNKSYIKYLNTPDTPIFKKSSILFGLHLAKAAIAQRGSIIVEGYFDVVCLHELGFEQTVGILGSAVSKEQIEGAVRHSNNKMVTLLFDADKAGDYAIERTCRSVLPRVSEDVQVMVAKLIDEDGECFSYSDSGEKRALKDPAELCSNLPRQVAVTAIYGVLERAVEWKTLIVNGILNSLGVINETTNPISIRTREEAIRRTMDFICSLEAPSHRAEIVSFVAKRLSQGKVVLQHQLEVHMLQMIDSRIRAKKLRGSNAMLKRKVRGPQAPFPNFEQVNNSGILEYAASVQPSKVPSFNGNHSIRRVQEAESVLLAVLLQCNELRDDVRELIATTVRDHEYSWGSTALKQLWDLIGDISRSPGTDDASLTDSLTSRLPLTLRNDELVKSVLQGRKVSNKSVSNLRVFIQQASAIIYDHSISNQRKILAGAVVNCSDDSSFTDSVPEQLYGFREQPLEIRSAQKLSEQFDAAKVTQEDVRTYSSLGDFQSECMETGKSFEEIEYSPFESATQDEGDSFEVQSDYSSYSEPNDDFRNYAFNFCADDIDKVLPEDHNSEHVGSEDPVSDIGVTFGLEDIYDRSYVTPRSGSSNDDEGRSSRVRAKPSVRKTTGNSRPARKISSSPQIQPQWANEDPGGKQAPSERRIPGGFYDLGTVRVMWDDDNIVV